MAELSVHVVTTFPWQAVMFYSNSHIAPLEFPQTGWDFTRIPLGCHSVHSRVSLHRGAPHNMNHVKTQPHPTAKKHCLSLQWYMYTSNSSVGTACLTTGGEKWAESHCPGDTTEIISLAKLWQRRIFLWDQNGTAAPLTYRLKWWDSSHILLANHIILRC